MKSKLFGFSDCLHPVRVMKNGEWHIYPCGKCASCLVKKSGRLSNDIIDFFTMHNGVSPYRPGAFDNFQVDEVIPINKYNCYFLTLTFNNEHLPLANIQFVGVDEKSNLNIYSIQASDNYTIDYKRTPTYGDSFTFKTKHTINKEYVGVLNFREIQLFFKRLKQDLKKHGKETQFSYIVLGEYGPKTHRPHFHVLLFSEDSLYTYLKQNLSKVWQNGFVCTKHSDSQTSQYLASYVASLAHLPIYLQFKPFRQKCVHSKEFYFSLCKGSEFEKKIFQEVFERKEYSFFDSKPIIEDARTVGTSLPFSKSYINYLYPRCFQYGLGDRKKNFDEYTLFSRIFEKYQNRHCNSVDILAWFWCLDAKLNYNQCKSRLYKSILFHKNALRFFYGSYSTNYDRCYRLYFQAINEFYTYRELKKLNDFLSDVECFTSPDNNVCNNADKKYYLSTLYGNAYPISEVGTISSDVKHFSEKQVSFLSSIGLDPYCFTGYNIPIPPFVSFVQCSNKTILENKVKHKTCHDLNNIFNKNYEEMLSIDNYNFIINHSNF